jgi:hypothetical protein
MRTFTDGAFAITGEAKPVAAGATGELTEPIVALDCDGYVEDRAEDRVAMALDCDGYVEYRVASGESCSDVASATGQPALDADGYVEDMASMVIATPLSVGGGNASEPRGSPLDTAFRPAHLQPLHNAPRTRALSIYNGFGDVGATSDQFGAPLSSVICRGEPPTTPPLASAPPLKALATSDQRSSVFVLGTEPDLGPSADPHFAETRL